MRQTAYKKAQGIVCAAGLVLLALLFVLWLGRNRTIGALPQAAALLCALLFAAVCLRFVPGWFSFWFDERPVKMSEPGTIPLPLLFAFGVLWALFNLAAVWAVLHYVNHSLSWDEYRSFWTSADAYHYLCIARDWYLSEGIVDRVVQLVFLPGYPLAVRLCYVFVGDYILSGLLVSSLSFAGALCVFYRLLLLDHPEATARLALVFLCLMPGSFFFFAPMSEGLFLLLCLSCLYSARKRRWLLAALFGALASFTRSLGLMLFVPLFFEIVEALLHGEKKAWRGLAALLGVPAGFAAYCLVNYTVSGNAFQFLIYQREHWNQQLGLFFNTAAYQTRYALRAEKDMLLGLWLPNLAALFGALGILLGAAKRLRPSYTAWALAYYVIAVGATWLLSAPRYMAALPALPLALALSAEKKAVRVVLLVLFALANLGYLILFALRRNVW